MKLSMSPTPFIAITGLLITATVCPEAIAQSADAPISDSTTAIDLTIPAWVGVEHSSSGAGFDGVTQFGGFVPLRQSPGRNITFFAPQFVVDNGGNIGGSLLLGHRSYDDEENRIFGGYIAFDNRQTDESEFSQIGLGLESLGEVWDFRFNAYLPLGDSRQLIDEDRVDTGLQVSTGFQGNLLLLSSRREQQITRLYETSLLGLDAEVGAKLAEWENGGSFRAFGGAYLYAGEGIEGALGWRLRAEARPTQNLTLGVALQNDDLFGTNLVASVGLTFPRIRPTGPITTETEAVQARLGEPIVRQPNIPIDIDQETDTTVEERTEPLRNPEEEQPYRFVHVTLGAAANGNGTFERPFNNLQAALEATVSDGNNIVYVDAGTNPDIPAFTIPNRVRVLSQGPEQLIAGLPFPGFPELPARLPFSPVVNYRDGILVRLPFSGDGRFPTIRDAGATDLVVMGDRTVLSGFRLIDAPANAVFANAVVDVEIRDNTITNAGDRGIFLNDVTGSVVLFDNTITNSRGGTGSGQGILIRNSVDGAVDASIQRQQLDNNRIGIEVVASGDPALLVDPQQIVSIDNTNIRNSTEQGMLLTSERLGNQQVAFQDGVIANSGAEGVFARAIQRGSQELILEDSIVSGSVNDGIRGQSGIEDGTSTAAQEVFVRRSRIENNGGNGILIEVNEVAAQEFAIDNNVIQNNGGDGIRGIANNLGFQEYVTDTTTNSSGISNNTIQNNNQGINIDINDSSTVIADIQDNTLTGNRTNGAPDLEVTTNTNTSRVCVVLNQNSSVAGIQLENNSAGLPALFQVGDLDTLSLRTAGSVTLRPDVSVFTNRPNISSCFND